MSSFSGANLQVLPDLVLDKVCNGSSKACKLSVVIATSPVRDGAPVAYVLGVNGSVVEIRCSLMPGDTPSEQSYDNTLSCALNVAGLSITRVAIRNQGGNISALVCQGGQNGGVVATGNMDSGYAEAFY